MACPNCRAEVQIQYGFCPACKAYVGPGSTEPSKENHFWLLGMVATVIILSAVALILKSRAFHEPGSPVGHSRHISEPGGQEHPVAHGGVAAPEELHGEGRLYFVPMGRQVIPIQSLADYYRQKFHVEITVLPEVKLKPSACVPARRQCIAEEMLDDAISAYPRISADPDAVIIVLTDEDIYPRSLGWDFTYSFREGFRFGIVSTYSADPGFWGKPPSDEAFRLAVTRQMLTKYVAMLYFHLPKSHDPTSIMYQPLIPDGGPDDLYESDLHSEQSANGRWDSGWPCISFRYSYETGEMRALDPPLSDCHSLHDANSTAEESFQAHLATGEFVVHRMDIQLDSRPAIEFRRGYRSLYLRSMEFGLGADHNYDSYLTSNGIQNLSVMYINREDGNSIYIPRASGGRGFTPTIAFQVRDRWGQFWGPRMTWTAGYFKELESDGAWSAYLPCHTENESCFWNAYHDAQGNELRFERDPQRALRRLMASDNQGIEFQLDEQGRIVEARASDGKQVSYKYDEGGCLRRVTRADGQVTLYTYDADHHMTRVAVIRKPGDKARILVSNEYDTSGRLTKHSISGQGVYRIEYGPRAGDHAGSVKMTDPAGRVWSVSISDEDFIAHTAPVRFPAVN